MKLVKLIVNITLLCSSFGLLAKPIIVTNPEQLDFKGDFVYAINFFGFNYGETSIGDARFVNVLANGTFAPVGFSITGFNRHADWSGGTNIGTNANDNALESILRTIIWSGEVSAGSMSFDLVGGENYKVQLLFSECCSNRNFSVTAQDGNFSEKYQSPHGFVSSTTQGYASVWEFKAQSTALNLDFMRLSGGDTNYHISGLTIEKVSESVVSVALPSTISIFAISLLGLLASRKTRRP